MERRRLAAKDARMVARLRRQHREERICPCCGRSFRVVVHGHRGRLRRFCADMCRHTHKNRQRSHPSADVMSEPVVLLVHTTGTTARKEPS
jgi:hypothetical protein